MEERTFLNQRRDDFAEGFIDVITTVDVRSSATGTAEFARGLRQQIRTLLRRIFAILATDCEADLVFGKRRCKAGVT